MSEVIPEADGYYDFTINPPLPAGVAIDPQLVGFLELPLPLLPLRPTPSPPISLLEELPLPPSALPLLSVLEVAL